MNQELLVRRRTRIRPICATTTNEALCLSNGPATETAAATTTSVQVTTTPSNYRPNTLTTHPVKFKWLASWWRTVVAAVHVAAFLMIVFGYFLRGDFHSGEECEMTYSMRHFVELTNGPAHAVYRLYKFTDRRDPRQQHLYTATDKDDTSDEDWCTPSSRNMTTAIVLYIPGHWGSYSQARSLGAHGLQWTRQHFNDDPQLFHQQQQFLRKGTWNGQSTTLQNFVYDVYAIDFSEQGGALHAKFLVAQSHYVASVLTTLMDKCHTSNTITLVGHSMGGLVARSIPMFHPQLSNNNLFIITLATPHERLPYGFDESLHEFYNLLDSSSHDEERSETTLVSISGGLRDEMIPPSVCHAVARKHTKTFSILANDVMTNGVFGMDHRAIVWCHGLLEIVRNVLHVGIVTKGNVSEHLLQSLLLFHNQSDGYDNAVATQYKTFRQRYGIIKSTAMESAMLYHFELLLGIYAVTGCVYHAFPSVPMVVVPCLVSVLGVWCTNTKVAVVVVLALVANTMYWLVRWVPTKTLSTTRSFQSQQLPPKSRHVWQLVLVFVVIQLGVALFGYFYVQNGSIVFLSLTSALFMSLILLLPIVSLERRTTQNETFLSLVLPVLPCLVVGKCYMIAWSIWMELDTSSMSLSDDVLNFLWRIVVPVYLRIILVGSCKGQEKSSSPWRWRWCTPFLHTLALFCFAPRVLQVGRGYVVGYLVACLAWIDVLDFFGCSASYYYFTTVSADSTAL